MSETQVITSSLQPGAGLRKISKAQELKLYIEENKPALAAVLPRIGLTAEAVTRTALSQIYKNPLLLECDKTSLMRAIVEAASLGLSFSLGRAYLVPFDNKVKTRKNGQIVESWRKEAQLIPGYLGLADIARRTGEVSSINAQAVYKGDDFKYEFGLTADDLHHTPKVEPIDSELTHAYAIVRFKDGGYQVVVMTRLQIEAIKKRSKAGAKGFGPWVTDYAAMAKKTVIKQVLKLCPASIELVRALDLDGAAESGESQAFDIAPIEYDSEVIEAETVELEAATRTATVKDALKESKKTAKRTERDEVSDNVMSGLAVVFGAKEAEADLAVSEATGGKVQSRAALIGASLEQLKQIQTHLRILADGALAAEAGGAA